MSMAVKTSTGYLGLLGAYLRFNLKGEMEFRASFISQVIFMILNDIFLLFFWWIFFGRFHDIRGWMIDDVMLLYAIGAGSFGVALGICGNCMRLPGIISGGQLDYYLALPKNVLFQVLVSRMSTSSLGDAIFGIVLGGILLKDPGKFAFFAGLLLVSATVFVSYCVTVGSLAFWLGSADGFFSAMNNAVITFTLYPEGIFRGLVRVFLYTVIPAGFLAYIPVTLLRRFDPALFIGLLGFAALSVVAASAVFRLGLRRYESGNLMAMRM